MLTLEIRGDEIFENAHECRYYRPYVLSGSEISTFYHSVTDNFSMISKQPLFTAYFGDSTVEEKCRGASLDAVVPERL